MPPRLDRAAQGAADVEIGWARAARARGNLVVGLAPQGHARLERECDVFLGTAAPDAGGVLHVDGETVSPAAAAPSAGRWCEFPA